MVYRAFLMGKVEAEMRSDLMIDGGQEKKKQRIREEESRRKAGTEMIWGRKEL